MKCISRSDGWLILPAYNSGIDTVKEETCVSPACIHASSEILYNLSPDYKEIDACTDFEELICGGWRDRHDLRPDQGDLFTGTIMEENSEQLLRHILEAPYPKDSSVCRAITTKPASTDSSCLAFLLFALATGFYEEVC